MYDYESMASAVAGIGIVLTILYVVFGLVTSVLSYYLACVPQEKTAKKLNAGSPWMAYVPVARAYQRTLMAGLPVWKMFFIGSIFTVALAFVIIILFALLLAQIKLELGVYIGVLLLVAYIVMYFIECYKYNCILCKKFNYDAPMAVMVMFQPVASLMFSYSIAFDNRVQEGEIARIPSSGGSSAPAPRSHNSSVVGLVGVAGMYSGATFPMKANEEFIIGRDGTLSNVVISTGNEKVSRRHCSIRYIAGTDSYEVTDFSMNGTWYGNSRLVKDQPMTIQRNTTIAIGDKFNQFRLL